MSDENKKDDGSWMDENKKDEGSWMDENKKWAEEIKQIHLPFRQIKIFLKQLRDCLDENGIDYSKNLAS